MPSDLFVLVAWRVGDASLTTIRGSTHATCRNCKAAVWIAPSSRTILLSKPEAVTLCFQCALAVDPDLKMLGPLTAEQHAEIRAYYRTSGRES